MSRQIIIKKNKEIAVWSTIIDDFVFEGNIDEYIVIRCKEASNNAKKDIKEIYRRLKAGEKPYYSFQVSYKEACEIRDELRRME